MHRSSGVPCPPGVPPRPALPCPSGASAPDPAGHPGGGPADGLLRRRFPVLVPVGTAATPPAASEVATARVEGGSGFFCYEAFDTASAAGSAGWPSRTGRSPTFRQRLGVRARRRPQLRRLRLQPSAHHRPARAPDADPLDEPQLRQHPGMAAGQPARWGSRGNFCPPDYRPAGNDHLVGGVSGSGGSRPTSRSTWGAAPSAGPRAADPAAEAQESRTPSAHPSAGATGQ